MTTDFTGERVVPGQVDGNLWNEHVARYAFASRLARGRRVLDAGCGTGYGAADLACIAQSVTAVDISSDALTWGKSHYSSPVLRWAQASCASLPFKGASFDLVISFEVIEHLADWPALLQEVRRVLAPGGQFIVSTPNKSFYAKTRELEGPNPYHEHEFEFEEFRDALLEVFPSVSIFLQDHAEGVLFRAVPPSAAAEVRVDSSEAGPREASFYVAVCAMSPQTGSPTFVYIPRAANMLAERLLHIERLEGEVRTKDKWLKEAQEEHAKLLDLHAQLKRDLEQSNAWAQAVNEKLDQAGKRIFQLQDELDAQRTGYEAQVTELSQNLEQRTQWALSIDQQLKEQTTELGKCVEALHATEATLEERTRWALELQEERAHLENMVVAAQASRWVRLGRAFGVGPELNKR